MALEAPSDSARTGSASMALRKYSAFAFVLLAVGCVDRSSSPSAEDLGFPVATLSADLECFDIGRGIGPWEFLLEEPEGKEEYFLDYSLAPDGKISRARVRQKGPGRTFRSIAMSETDGWLEDAVIAGPSPGIKYDTGPEAMRSEPAALVRAFVKKGEESCKK